MLYLPGGYETKWMHLLVKRWESHQDVLYPVWISLLAWWVARVPWKRDFILFHQDALVAWFVKNSHILVRRSDRDFIYEWSVLWNDEPTMVILVIFRISPKIQSSLLSWILCKDQATALDACIKKNHTTAAQEELKLTCLVILHCNCKVKILVQLSVRICRPLGKRRSFLVHCKSSCCNMWFSWIKPENLRRFHKGATASFFNKDSGGQIPAMWGDAKLVSIPFDQI